MVDLASPSHVCMYLFLGMPCTMFSYNILTMHVHYVFVFPLAAKPTATAQPAKEQFLISPITGERFQLVRWLIT